MCAQALTIAAPSMTGTTAVDTPTEAAKKSDRKATGTLEAHMATVVATTRVAEPARIGVNVSVQIEAEGIARIKGAASAQIATKADRQVDRSKITWASLVCKQAAMLIRATSHNTHHRVSSRAMPLQWAIIGKEVHISTMGVVTELITGHCPLQH